MTITCVKCDKPTNDDETPVTCSFCNAHFHPQCVVSTNGRVEECIRCISSTENNVSGASKKDDNADIHQRNQDDDNKSEKSNQDQRSEKSNAKSKGSKRSGKSSKILGKELALLEEKKRLDMDLIKQREKLLDEQVALNKTYIEAKAKILREMDQISQIDAQSVASSERGRRKVANWLESTDKIGNNIPEAVPEASAMPKNVNLNHNLPEGGFQPPVEKVFQPPVENPQPSTSNSKLNMSRTLSKEVLANRKSDAKNLSVFDGSPKHWPTFASEFITSTEMCQFQDIDNIARLRNCLKGKARKAVEGALSQPGNVPYIMETLEQLFGKPEFIINEMIKDVQEFSQLKIDKFGEIVEFSLAVTNMTTTMKAASMSNHLWNPNLLQDIVKKLPVQLQREWAQFMLSNRVVNLESFSFWMQSKAREYACLLTEPPNFGENRAKKGVVNFHDEEKKTTTTCFSCEGDCKDVSSCDSFQKMSYKEKFAVVNNHNLCKRCLKRHKYPCLRKESCGINECAYKHNPLLHKYEAEEINAHHHHQRSSSLFKIIPITLHHNGKSLSTFALLDDGSSITLIDSKIARTMGVRGTPRSLCLKWTSDTHKYEPESEQMTIIASGANGKKMSIHNLHTVSSLNLPTQTIDAKELGSKYEHLREVPLESYVDAQPTVLIGLNNVHLTLAHKTKMGGPDEPVAIKTLLGWVVFGRTSNQDIQEVYHICECNLHDNQLDEIVRDYIALDNLNIVRPATDLISKEDERSLTILENTTSFVGDRYETGLIWRYDKFQMPHSYSMALRRLKCLEKQMTKNPDLRDQMQSQINEYVQCNYARELTENESKNKKSCWYLPLFVVRNPNKPSKIRMVWDAAAAVDGVCLNSFLLKGPDQLANLPGILFRFRQFKIAVVGDIRHMFHQIRIIKEDQHFLRFLWSDAEGGIKEYMMEVMSFGPTCSPASAQFVKNLNASKFEVEYPRAARAIKENHYVDDMLESVDSIAEAKELVDQVKFIHLAGGFQIRNFLSNSIEVARHSNEEKQHPDAFLLPENNTEKVLGMWWDVKRDNFKYCLKFNKGNVDILNGSRVPTKREVLQVLMSVYDPLGLIAHLLIYPKILMQQVWKSAIGWDENIPENLTSSWSKWIESLKSITKLKISRWYGITEKTNEIELHIFVDASLDAFAAAAYIRYTFEGRIRCKLISAKSKVAPLKVLSVPRLELNAAVIGARLATHIKTNHSIKFKSTTFWTDSKSVWCWLRSETRRYKPYVNYRVAEILEVSSAQQWNWLPTEINVADKATRKVIQPIRNRSEWFRGPKFLRKSREFWPKQLAAEESTNEELRPHILFHFTTFPLSVTKFSKWNRLRRSMAYLKRFVHNMLCIKYKHQKRKGIITEEESNEADECAVQAIFERKSGLFTKQEYIDAETEIFKIAQLEGFPDEITAVKKNMTLDKSSPIKKCLPFLDDEDLLRSNSRLASMDGASEDFRRPILLPNDHYITKLLIQHYHEKFWHQLHESAVNEINQKFLIPSIKAAYKKVRACCQKCKNQAATPTMPLMASLHQARLQVNFKAFTFIGIDYFGPLNVAVGRQRQKRWGCLITCLTTRGIHIEVSHSLSTDSCIMSLNRFMARRGHPQEIYSDQGTNFKGSSNELKLELEKLDHNKLSEEFVTTQTQWFFNPPGAPHMGGAWERLVRCVKNALFAALPTRTPREELLQTMMCQVEFVVNSRPLTTVPLETEDSEVLTPNHFLLGSSNGSKPFCFVPDDNKFLLDSWKMANRFMSHYYRKFIREYLPTIRRRTKDFNPMTKEVAVGDVVVIIDDNFSTTLWKKGIVLDVHKSRDGFVRKAIVRTQNGVYERAAAKLAVLDVLNTSGNPVELPGGNVTSRTHPTTEINK